MAAGSKGRSYVGELDPTLSDDVGDLDFTAERLDVATQSRKSMIDAALEPRQLGLGHGSGARELGLGEIEVLPKLLQGELADLLLCANRHLCGGVRREPP